METENKRIPFDWEKYQSGEYEAVCRDGSKPEQLTYNSKAESYPIAAWVGVRMCTFDNKGKYDLYGKEHSYDLFLIPKPKKFQAWINLYSNGIASSSYVSEEIANEFNKFSEHSGVVRVECRLIEWEG
jgi:hypothetical protein